jgi:hypothetical protein
MNPVCNKLSYKRKLTNPNILQYLVIHRNTRQFRNFSAISWREQVNFHWEHVQVHFVLDQHVELDFIVLAHWNSSLRILNNYTLFISIICGNDQHYQLYWVFLNNYTLVISIVIYWGWLTFFYMKAYYKLDSSVNLNEN